MGIMKGMDKKTQLENALHEAIRAGDDLIKRTLRMAISAVRQVEIDKRSELDEAAVVAILHKEVKSRQEAIEEARRANRPDLAKAAQEEIKILEAFLPQQLSQDELESLARQAAAEAGASSPADMGKVMKILVPRLEGRATGQQASQAVRKILQ
jgi:uncharacterized protein